MKLTASDIHVELGGNEILKGIDAAIKGKGICRNYRTKRKWKKYVSQNFLWSCISQPRENCCLRENLIKTYQRGKINQSIGMFFQDFALFHASLRENVGYGDLKNIEKQRKKLQRRFGKAEG